MELFERGLISAEDIDGIEALLTDVIDWLNNRYELALPDSKTIGILNGKGWMQIPEKLATPLREGDAIGLMPIIHGG